VLHSRALLELFDRGRFSNETGRKGKFFEDEIEHGGLD
jgi:hypothetical protein